MNLTAAILSLNPTLKNPSGYRDLMFCLHSLPCVNLISVFTQLLLSHLCKLLSLSKDNSQIIATTQTSLIKVVPEVIKSLEKVFSGEELAALAVQLVESINADPR
jgi:hypothetical protein